MNEIWRKGWIYNALDSVATHEAWLPILRRLSEQENLPAYRRKCDVCGPLVYMMAHGILVDFDGVKEKREKLLTEAKEVQEELNSLAGMELNANSPKQLTRYFYGVKGYPPYKRRGHVSVDKFALLGLQHEKKSREAGLILRIRRCLKLASYLEEWKYDLEEDGTRRIRCAFNPTGSRFSRLSSSENIFGTGGNLQNWTHELLCYLMADEGYVGFALDLSNAENRIWAHVGRVKRLIEAFGNGEDVHSLTASGLFNLPPKEVKRLAKEKSLCDVGDGTHTFRFWGKKTNHSTAYDISKREFALQVGLDQRTAKRFQDKWHRLYPEVRENYHAEVRDSIRRRHFLENLMGRKTYFLGQICDKLFKEGYSCIPQGTVGDIVDERGLNFTYYNQDVFRPLELLNQVHDEVVFQLPLSLGWEEIGREVRLVKEKLETPLVTKDGLRFVIPVDVSVFKRMKKGKECKKGPRGLSDREYGEELRRLWEVVEK